MYENSGSPAFRANTTYTANPSAYEIDTGTDFTSNMNFLIGLGGTDDAGRMKSLATVCIAKRLRYLARKSLTRMV
jgi:hypothetical protein